MTLISPQTSPAGIIAIVISIVPAHEVELECQRRLKTARKSPVESCAV